MKKLSAFGLVLMIFLAACKKDKEEISLKGKWNLENYITKEYDNGVLTDTETISGSGTTIDFQNNGNVVSTESGNVSSVPYTIKPNSKVEVGGETYEIRNLTASSVTLFIREDVAPDNYIELFINLKR